MYKSKKDMLGPLTRALVGVPVKMLGLMLDIANRLGSDNGENFFKDLATFVREWKQSVINATQKVKVYLRPLFVENLGATEGFDNYDTAKELFKGYFDSNIESYGVIFSGVAPESDICVDELVLDAKFKDFLGNNAEDLEELRILGSQFLKFCRDKPDKLRQNGHANFAIVTKKDEPVEEDLSNVLVVYALVFDDGLEADAYKLSDGRVWLAKHCPRILYPQIET